MNYDTSRLKELAISENGFIFDPMSGSTFTVKIPLTLAIVPALLVRCAGERFAIPEINVVELVQLKHDGESPMGSSAIEMLHNAMLIHDDIQDGQQPQMRKTQAAAQVTLRAQTRAEDLPHFSAVRSPKPRRISPQQQLVNTLRQPARDRR